MAMVEGRLRSLPSATPTPTSSFYSSTMTSCSRRRRLRTTVTIVGTLLLIDGCVPFAVVQPSFLGADRPSHTYANQGRSACYYSRLPFDRSSRAFLQTTRLTAKQDDDMELEPDDVPEDWTEQDILAELGASPGTDSAGAANKDDDQVDGVLEDEDGNPIVSQREDDDEDDDDVDLDELDLDLDDEEDDDEEDIVEEVVGDQDPVIVDSLSDTVWEDDQDAVSAESSSADLEWDEDEDGGVYELMDDPEDPDYMKQKGLVEKASDDAEQRVQDANFDAYEFVANEMTPGEAESFDKLPFFKDLEAKARSMVITEGDVKKLDFDKEVAGVSDIFDDDEYPRHDAEEPNLLEDSVGLTDDDMESLDGAYKEISRLSGEEPWDKVVVKEMATDWGDLSNQTLEEIEAALEELGGSAYNVTRWLLYDLDFNVTNLILASVKHNRNAPILFQHWYPQLVTYERYKHARDSEFDFNWEDVENADLDELKRYYAGFGYDTIPEKAPAETGIIGFDDMDEEEIKMATFESWMTEVYNPEWDRKDFDDDDMKDEDNVFSEFYDPPQHPDLPTLEDAEEDIQDWREDQDEDGFDDPEARDYRDMMGKTYKYEVEKDEEFEREFRGHLIIACSGQNEDLDVAEKITSRFEKEFGKKVFVETRVMSLAREDDNVFEVWLESYEIDLLHSKKRATSNTQDWQGPAECDDSQIDYLVEQVRFLISDDARYSYRMDLEHTD